MEYHEDNVLVSMNDIIEDLYKGMMKFSPDINLEGLKIDIDVDDDINDQDGFKSGHNFKFHINPRPTLAGAYSLCEIL